MKQADDLWRQIMDKLSRKPLAHFNKSSLYIGYGKCPEKITLTSDLFDQLLALCTVIDKTKCPEQEEGEVPKRFVVFEHDDEYINLNSQTFIRYVKYDRKGMILINTNCIPSLKGVMIPCNVSVKKLEPHLHCFGIYEIKEGYLINAHYHKVHRGSVWVTYTNKNEIVKLCTCVQGVKTYKMAALSTHRAINIFQTLDQRETIDALCTKVDKRTPFWYVLQPLINDLPKEYEKLHNKMLTLIPKVTSLDQAPERQRGEKCLDYYFNNKVLNQIAAYNQAHNIWPVQHYPEYAHLYAQSNLEIPDVLIKNEKEILKKKKSTK